MPLLHPELRGQRPPDGGAPRRRRHGAAHPTQGGKRLTPEARGDAYRGLWVYLEQQQGHLLPVGLELLGKGRELADVLGEPLTAIVLGHKTDDLGREAIRYGADEVLLADHPLLEGYTTDAHAKVMAQLIEERKPNVLLVGATYNGRDLAGRLAVRLSTGLTANATRLEVDRERGLLLSAVPGFGGSILAIIKSEYGRPQMSTVRPGIFAPLEPSDEREGGVEKVTVDLRPEDIRCRVLERDVLPREEIGSTERVLVAGMGTGGDLKLLEELASLLEASIGVTRPLVDLGVAMREKQVGSTGISLRSKLAVVLGASGASHFVSGLRDVGTVVAINKDEKAPIFDEADLCVIGDLFEILPSLIEELEKVKVGTA
ncbi:MAG: electron transfer flavoprotein subunit alpha/FixB family protein [Thermoplasmata archaeon]